MSIFDDIIAEADAVFSSAWDAVTGGYDSSLDFLSNGMALQQQQNYAAQANQTAMAQTGQGQYGQPYVIQTAAPAQASSTNNNLIMYGLIGVGALLGVFVLVKVMK